MSTQRDEQAEAFLTKVAEAEKLAFDVQRGDVHNAVKVAKTHGYDVTVESLWSAITKLQAHRDKALPTWILDRIRFAVHD
jgi:hypothetical protein